jgi:outer membrane protein TolC
LEAFGQVANILQSLSHDAQLEEAQMRALNTASRAVELERINYQRGGATILDLLDAQRQHQQALLGYIRAEAQRLSNTVELYIALGGASTASSAGS